MLLIPLLLLLQSFHGMGYCGAILPVGISSEQKETFSGSGILTSGGNNDEQLQPGNGVGAYAAIAMATPMEQKGQGNEDLSSNTADSSLVRHRRHIGSIAAFRGLPAPFNKLQGSSSEWASQSNGLDRRSFMMNDEEEINDINKDKRYPEIPQPTVLVGSPHRPNPVLMRNMPPSAPIVFIPETPVATIPHSEVRARAVNRLLRLLAEAKVRNSPSISKKFLGALARGNALPLTPPRALSSGGIQYKGSMAIPLPGKRSGVIYVPDYDWISDVSDNEEEQYSTDVNFEEDPISLDDYEDMVSLKKRHISSVAKSAKPGFLRQSRDYNRVPLLSF